VYENSIKNIFELYKNEKDKVVFSLADNIELNIIKLKLKCFDYLILKLMIKLIKDEKILDELNKILKEINWKEIDTNTFNWI